MRRLVLALLLLTSPASARNRDEAVEAINEAEQQTVQINEQLKQPSVSDEERQRLEQERAAALTKIDKAADSARTDPRVQARATGAFMAAKEPQRALPRAEQVVALAPRNPQAYVMRGQVKRAMGDYAGAEEDAGMALRIDPNNKEAQTLFALSHGRGGKRVGGSGVGQAEGGQDGAGPGRQVAPAPVREVSPAAFAPNQGASARASALVAAAAANADRLKAFDFFKQAEAKTGLGDHAAAKALLDKAVEADKDNPQALAARAGARLKTGDPRGALADANAALLLDGKQARAYLARGGAREALGETADAVLADYKLAAELDPDLTSEYQSALARHGRGEGRLPSAGEDTAAEDLKSGALAPAVRKNLPFILAGLGLLVVAGGALWLKRGGADDAS